MRTLVLCLSEFKAFGVTPDGHRVAGSRPVNPSRDEAQLESPRCVPAAADS